MAEYFGEAPANLKACEETSDKTSARPSTPTDEAYSAQVHYWTTPIKQCLDGRTDVTCTDYAEWTKKWLGDQGLTRGDHCRGRLPPPAPRPALAGLLAAPLIWLVVVYLGSLAASAAHAFCDAGLVHRRGGADLDPGQLQRAVLTDATATIEVRCAP